MFTICCSGIELNTCHWQESILIQALTYSTLRGHPDPFKHSAVPLEILTGKELLAFTAPLIFLLTLAVSIHFILHR